MASLYDPLTVGALTLKNRILMAPLTRCRAGDSRVPNDLMVEYYRQRAGAGLIFSEATSVTPMGVGYAGSPGIWSEEQVVGWKKVTDAVHEAGGQMLLQLWHVGRISHPMFLDGADPVAPSAMAAKGYVSLVRPHTAYAMPRALETDEIAGVVDAFRKGAENAKRAGFDGVEIHGANGYLLDQFLQDKTNQRTDQYGGSLENRARFPLEVVDAVVDVWGADRVGYHISPCADTHDMGDSDLLGTFSYLARELGKRKLAFLCAREGLGANRIGPELKKAFGGVYFANEKFTAETAQQALDAGEADAVLFGKLYIANPDLVERFAQHTALNEPHSASFYGGGAEGYTDYPTLQAQAKAS